MELMSEHTGEWEEAESRLLLMEVENITIIYNEIAGTYVGNTTEGKLKYLDLSEANIVAGGDAYATAVYDDDEKIVSVGRHTKDCYTEDNVVGSLMLSGEFSEVIFPNSATRIDAWPIGSIAWKSLKK